MMGWVTNIIISHSGMYLSELLGAIKPFTDEYGDFKSINPHSCGGNAVFEADLIFASYIYADIHLLINLLKRCKFKELEQDHFQLMIKEQEDDLFTIYNYEALLKIETQKSEINDFRVYLWDDKNSPNFEKFVKWFKLECAKNGDTSDNPHSIYSLTGEKNFGLKDGKPYSGFDLPATISFARFVNQNPDIFKV